MRATMGHRDADGQPSPEWCYQDAVVKRCSTRFLVGILAALDRLGLLGDDLGTGAL